MRARLRQRFVGYSCTLWHSVYAALNGVRAVNYLPDDIFFNVFERRLNPRLRRDTYRDKNFYDRLNWPGLPETVLRVINGELFDHAYRSVDLATGLALARHPRWTSLLSSHRAKLEAFQNCLHSGSGSHGRA